MPARTRTLRNSFLLAFLLGASLPAAAYDNAPRIAELVARYTKGEATMKSLRVGSVTFVYDTRFFDLDPEVRKNVVSGKYGPELATAYAGKFAGQIRILSSIAAATPVFAYYQDDGGGDAGWVSTDNEFTNACGQLVYLPQTTLTYTYQYATYRRQAFPGVLMKFQLHDKDFEQVAQPFFRLSLTTTANADLPLLKDPEASEVVGTVAVGTEVQVLGVAYGKGWYQPFEAVYLVEGKTGILGWVGAVLIRKEKDSGLGTDVFNLEFLRFSYSLVAG